MIASSTEPNLFCSVPYQNHTSHLDQHPRISEQFSGHLNLHAQIVKFLIDLFRFSYYNIVVYLLYLYEWLSVFLVFSSKIQTDFDLHCQCVINFKDRAIKLFQIGFGLSQNCLPCLEIYLTEMFVVYTLINARTC